MCRSFTDRTENLLLQAKVQVLKKAIREKEETIMHLSHDLKTLRIAIENSTIDDLGKLHSLQYMSDNSSQYHHPHYVSILQSYSTKHS